MGESYTLITGASSGSAAALRRSSPLSRRLILAGRKAEKLEACASNLTAPEQHLIWVRDLSRLEGSARNWPPCWPGKRFG